VANILKHAFAPGETGTYRIAAELTPAELAISFLDQGRPLDPALAGAGQEPDPAAVPGGHVHGLYRIRQAVDEAHWINHGREGKELRLVKHLPHVPVTEQLPAAALAPFTDDEPPAPPQEYTIRRLQPADAVGVSQCIYRVYGYSYEHDELYYPERIARLNATGEMISVVALDAGGQVVGHYALERPDLGRVAERGVAVTAPAHRRRGLMERMRSLLDAEGKEAGLVATYGEAVTVHTYSQHADEQFGSRVTGIVLGEWPGSLQFKGIREGPLPQRSSYVMYSSYLVAPPTATVYAPPRHREMLARIYAGLEAPVEFGRVAAEPLPEHGQVVVEFHQHVDYGVIRVRQVGVDTAAELRRARRDLCEVSGAAAVFLELPLAQPGTPTLFEAAAADGFFFSGLGPQFARDGDALRLQFLNVDLDSSLLQILSPFARELLDYVEADRQAAAAGRPGV
jgi:hypothetical protein